MTLRRTILLAPIACCLGQKMEVVKTGYPKPFVYPIVALDGTVLSRGWPIAPRVGDSQDHTWHRGIWWGHGDINGHDFWREQKGTGTIRVDRAEKDTLRQSLVTTAGNVIARLVTRVRIGEHQRMRQVDVSLELEAVEALRFGDTDDGGFGVRLREEFREDRGARLVNSEGGVGAKAIWGKAAAWTDYSAVVEGKKYGVAILSHPQNLRHPAGWHARNYGLNSANPFAASSFASEKGGQRGAYVLSQGKKLRLRYRVLIHEGDAVEAGVAARYQEYAR